MAYLRTGRTLIFHTRWMEFYAGPEINLPTTHFRWIASTGDIGGESENFLDLDGICYGYVPFHHQTNLGRVSNGVTADKLDDVLIVFTATIEGKGARIVGWYEGATIEIEHIDRPNGHHSPCKATVPASRAFLLPEDKRDFVITRMQKGYPGISPLTYLTSLNSDLERSVVEYLNGVRGSGLEPVTISRPDKNLQKRIYQSDPLLRSLVERAAIEKVKAFYEDLLDPVHSRESEKVGWDLQTQSGKRIEVKGRFSDSFDIELTPNEYEVFKHAISDPTVAESYRLAIVARALDPDSDLSIFRYWKGNWRCELTERSLVYVERPGARVGLNPEL